MSLDTTPQIVTFKNITIPVKAVMRRLGYPSDGKFNGQVKPIFEVELGEAPEYFEPRGVYRILPVDRTDDETVGMKEEKFRICSRQVAKMLRDSDYVVLFMTTLGPKLEEEVKRLLDQDHMVEAVILDAIGSETADAVADKMHREILKELAEKEGYSVTPRFSPGYGDWPVTVQRDVLSVCGGELVGISVNESSLMIPRKSVSAVLGWVKKR